MVRNKTHLEKLEVWSEKHCVNNSIGNNQLHKLSRMLEQHLIRSAIEKEYKF